MEVQLTSLREPSVHVPEPPASGQNQGKKREDHGRSDSTSGKYEDLPARDRRRSSVGRGMDCLKIVFHSVHIFQLLSFPFFYLWKRRSVLERTKYTIVDGRFPLSLEELHHRPPSHPVTVPKDSLASLQPNIGEENASTEEDQAKGKEMSAVESDAFSGYHGISAQNSTIRSIPCSVAPDSSSESPGDKS